MINASQAFFFKVVAFKLFFPFLRPRNSWILAIFELREMLLLLHAVMALAEKNVISAILCCKTESHFKNAFFLLNASVFHK